MTRLSLSPELEEWEQGRYRLKDDDSGSSSDSSEAFVTVSSSDDCNYSGSDDDDDDDDDYPHPVGFPAKVHSSWGRTRFCLDPSVTCDSIEQEWSGMRRPLQFTHLYPPLDSFYIDSKIAPTPALIHYEAHEDHKLRMQEESDRDMDQITHLLAAATTVDTRALLPPPVIVPNPLDMLAEMAQKIQLKMNEEKRRMQKEQLEAAKALKLLLEQNQSAASRILNQERQLEQEAKAQEDAENERQRQEDELVAENRRKKRADDDAAAVAAEEEAKATADAHAKEAAKVAAKEAAKTEYLEKAKKLVAQLQQLRASIEPFENSKAVGKRRLNMKKVVRGKVNTLAENVEKIKSVAFEVGKAIADARAEDEQCKAQIQAGNTQIPPEMTRGKRYLVDLLCSDIMVRVQAEGFNGLRGDGFPIANMMAIVSLDNKDVNLVLAAHIYTVCPIAIPKLPSPASDSSEEALMDSLGMVKDKKGEYENFDRFLTRTEGIVAFVANIMASNPPNHQLMGGNRGAVEWLSRFLRMLPPAPQSPLPLVTASVLDAFLTGAGHMLANMHPEHFSRYLRVITEDVVTRLDEGPIGAPSAIRLKKTVKDGFDGFKNKLPAKALPELYCGANSTGGHGGGGTSSHPGSGLGGGTASNPFGGGGSSQPSTTSNPFGGSTTSQPGTLSSPFGRSATTSQPSAPSLGFGRSTTAAPANPFGGNATSTPSTSNNSFGGITSSQPPNPFGGKSVSSNAFGPPTSGFGTPGPAPPTGFGTFGAPASSLGGSEPGFGLSDPGDMGEEGGMSTDDLAIGQSLGLSGPSSFGGQPNRNPSTFGTPSPASSGGLFGGTPAQSTPFGAASSGFAQPGASNGFGTFGAPVSAPSSGFGAFGAPAPSPSSGFGAFGAPAPTPPTGFGAFGGPAPAPSTGFGAFGAPAPAPSSGFGAFGAPTPAPSSGFGAFGAPAPSSGFGGFSASAPASGFGAFGATPASGFGASAPLGAFGQQKQGFGSSNPSQFGAPVSSTFGSQPGNTTSPFGAFRGAAPTPSPFSGNTGGFGGGRGFGGNSSGGGRSQQICKFYQQGTCKFGANCRFLHPS